MDELFVLGCEWLYYIIHTRDGRLDPRKSSRPSDLEITDWNESWSLMLLSIAAAYFLVLKGQCLRKLDIVTKIPSAGTENAT